MAGRLKSKQNGGNSFLIIMSKLCRKCGQIKPLEDFTSDAHQLDGKSCYCRDCTNSRQRVYLACRREGRRPALARFTDEELLYELAYREEHRESNDLK